MHEHFLNTAGEHSTGMVAKPDTDIDDRQTYIFLQMDRLFVVMLDVAVWSRGKLQLAWVPPWKPVDRGCMQVMQVCSLTTTAGSTEIARRGITHLLSVPRQARLQPPQAWLLHPASRLYSSSLDS